MNSETNAELIARLREAANKWERAGYTRIAALRREAADALEQAVPPRCPACFRYDPCASDVCEFPKPQAQDAALGER